MKGKVEVAVVSSPCDNVIHSLVNTSAYSGSFLPGFIMSNSSKELEDKEEEGELLCDMDHVTYVCREGESLKILAFYKVSISRISINLMLIRRHAAWSDSWLVPWRRLTEVLRLVMRFLSLTIPCKRHYYNIFIIALAGGFEADGRPMVV